MTSTSTDDDEFDAGFMQALAQSSKPGYVRDANGNLIRTAGSGVQDKTQGNAMLGRIADGESNLNYSAEGAVSKSKVVPRQP